MDSSEIELSLEERTNEVNRMSRSIREKEDELGN